MNSCNIRRCEKMPVTACFAALGLLLTAAPTVCAGKLRTKLVVHGLTTSSSFDTSDRVPHTEALQQELVKMQERLLELRGAVIAATCPRGPSRYQALGVATDVAQLCPAQQKAWHQNYYNVKRRFCSVTGSSLYDGALLEFETHTCEENATSAAFMRKLTEAWKLCEIFRENVYPFVGAELRPNIMHVKATVAARTRSGECNRHAGGLLPWESWHVPSPPAVAVGTAGAGSSSQASSRSSSESNGTAGHQRRTAAAEQTSGPQGFFAALSHPDEDGADEGEGHHPQRQSLDEDGTVDGDLSGRLARLDVNVNGRREEGKNPTSLGKRARKKRDKAQEEQKSADELELLFDAWLAEEPFECRQQLFATSKRPKRQLYVEIALDLMFRRQTGSVYANKYEIEQWVAKRDNAAKEEFKISDEDEERANQAEATAAHGRDIDPRRRRNEAHGDENVPADTSVLTWRQQLKSIFQRQAQQDAMEIAGVAVLLLARFAGLHDVGATTSGVGTNGSAAGENKEEMERELAGLYQFVQELHAMREEEPNYRASRPPKGAGRKGRGSTGSNPVVGETASDQKFEAWVAFVQAAQDKVAEKRAAAEAAEVRSGGTSGERRGATTSSSASTAATAELMLAGLLRNRAFVAGFLWHDFVSAAAGEGEGRRGRGAGERLEHPLFETVLQMLTTDAQGRIRIRLPPLNTGQSCAHIAEARDPFLSILHVGASEEGAEDATVREYDSYSDEQQLREYQELLLLSRKWFDPAHDYAEFSENRGNISFQNLNVRGTLSSSRSSGAEKYLAHDQSVERGQWIGLAREGLGEEFSSHDFVQGSLRFLAFKDVPFLRQVPEAGLSRLPFRLPSSDVQDGLRTPFGPATLTEEIRQRLTKETRWVYRRAKEPLSLLRLLSKNDGILEPLIEEVTGSGGGTAGAAASTLSGLMSSLDTQVAFRNRWKTALPDELFPDRNLMELLSLLEHTLAEGAGIELLSSPQKKEKVRTFLLGEEGKYAHGPPQLPGLLATGSSEEGGPRGRQQQNPAADNSKALYKWLSRRLDIPADLVQIFWASRETEVADRVTRILETKDAVNNMLWWAVVLLAGRGAGAGAGGSYYEMSSLIGMHYVSHRREAVEREIAQLLVHDASNQTRAAIRRAFVRLFPCARSSTFRLPGYALPR